MADRYENVARGQARVTAQIGRVAGDVTFGSPPEPAADGSAPADLAALIEQLRTELRAAAARDELDSDSAVAAEQEIDEAADCVPATDEAAQSRLVLALKRMRGLVDGVAGLTLTVTETIAAVQGLR